jgi:tRNA-2-methylthio-N6-dimethylallyladenosine synthase
MKGSQSADISLAPAVYVETYGCQMNVADSQLVMGILRRAGYQRVEQPDQADVILLNTCAIREHAEERVLGRLSDLARLRNRRPELKLGLLGCMAQHDRQTLLQKAPYLDLVAGPDTYARLPQMLRQANFDPIVDVRLNRDETYAGVVPEHEPNAVRAYVTVMRGCDEFCAFCVVPYVRGRERSAAPDAVIDEVQALARRGVKEIVLLGQTVNAYRHGETGFAELLRMVCAVDGIERVRFTSPHPRFMSSAVIDAIASEPKVQPYLHLPVQSGSDRVLQTMARGYRVGEYRALVERLRAAIPELALSTDIIVGFHGENDDDFEATLELLREVSFDSAFIFKYSLRENTKAYRLGDTVSETEKGERLATAIALQERISLLCNQRLVGRDFPVLIEGEARRGNGMLSGKTPQFKTAVFPASDGLGPGDTVLVRVESVTSHSLRGAPAKAPLQAGSAPEVRRPTGEMPTV